jgi:hypothetical protein
MKNKGGRPTNAQLLAKRLTPKEYLDGRDSTSMWNRYLDSEDDKVSLDCWKYLHDRVMGKPAQSLDLNHGGEIEVIKRVVLGKLG